MADATQTPDNASATGTREVDTLLDRVVSALEDQKDTQVFAIGGKLDASASHITIRWDGKSTDDDEHVGRRVRLPLQEGHDETNEEGDFQKLLQDCAPATFGLGQKDVLDESYRKAGKMDTSDFCTNFNPYEHGIMDAVIQALAQSHQSKAGQIQEGQDEEEQDKDEKVEEEQNRGLKAELYKLNVYSGPSGKFKSHVDTPRSDEQMGSLVVCLPLKHSGGALAVRHAGNETLFDWSPQSSSVIQWAAFFSDCEHEVLNVTEGHRVTLTYNLYWTSYGPASMADNLKSIDQTSLYFFSAVRDLLACPEFLPEGGRVGFTCAHAYPHTSKSLGVELSSMLKGIDMVVYQVLKRLTSSARVAVYLHDESYHVQLHERWENEIAYGNKSAPEPPKDPGATLGDHSRGVGMWAGNYDDLEDPVDFKDGKFNFRTHRWEFKTLYKREPVTWLNHQPLLAARDKQEVDVAYIAYGNEASIESYYSSAVLIAELEPASKRSKEGAKM